MITTSSVQYMLREAKSRAKQKEFNIDVEDYPRYVTDSKDLDYSAVYALSKYVEAIIDKQENNISEFYKDLDVVSQYFNAATNIVRDHDYSIDYLLSGASTYFLLDDFGSAKALLDQLLYRDLENDDRRVLFAVLYAMYHRNNNKNIPQNNRDIYEKFLAFLDTGNDIDNIYNKVENYISFLLRQQDDLGVYYSQILYAIIEKADNNSSWRLLPTYSNLSIDIWSPFLKQSYAPKILWTAQQLIGEAGLLKGNNGIIQLPTGVGKTKSLELIIRSSFLSNRTNSVIIISPLRALCSEIKIDMYKAFGKEIKINQLSDALQEDYVVGNDDKKHITICTPEKLKYIMHHNMEVLYATGLFVFDEGHLFDSPKRGASYELLVTTIKTLCLNDTNKQCVFISAVMQNADAIKNWLFNDAGVLVSSQSIRTTEKNIGFLSTTSNSVDYYIDNDYSTRNYWVQNVIKEYPLLTPTGRISKTKKFPDSTAKDVSLYLANLLCHNGSVAIYLSRPDWIETYIKRIIEIKSTQNLFENLRSEINEIERDKLKRLMDIHYGVNSSFSKGVLYGVLPHYADLEDGIKTSVEYAIKNDFFKVVICTSTLAQGVNIPIKYLLIAEFSAYQRELQAKEIQNLIGRTARSGMHTEGSIIVTDIKFYEERNNSKGYIFQWGGKYNWEKKTALFNPQNSEPCGSCILEIFIPLNICNRYEPVFLGGEVIEAIKNGDITLSELSKELVQVAEKIESKYNKEEIIRNINKYIRNTLYTLDSIETHLCFLKGIEPDLSFEEIAENLSKTTLAYALADDKTKTFINNLFLAIAEQINSIDEEQNVIYQAKAMTSINLTKQIKEWLVKNADEVEKQDVQKTINLFYLLYYSVNENIELEETVALKVLELWLSGNTIVQIQNKIFNLFNIDKTIYSIEKFCRRHLSYTLSFLIGNVIDLSEELTESTKLFLKRLQKRVKYGLPTTTSISIYEKGICDRAIAQDLASLIGFDDVDDSYIIPILQNKKEELNEKLKLYPTVFYKLFNEIII